MVYRGFSVFIKSMLRSLALAQTVSSILNKKYITLTISVETMSIRQTLSDVSGISMKAQNSWHCVAYCLRLLE